MSKLIQTDEGRVIGHRRAKAAVAVIVGLLIIAAGVIIVFQVVSRMGTGSSDQALTAEDKDQLEGTDSRSMAVRIASLAAQKQAMSGDTDGAVRTLNTAINKADTAGKVSLYRQLSSVYASTKRQADATNALDQALKLAPNDWTLYKSLGLVDAAFGDYAGAKTNFTKADDVLKTTGDYEIYHPELETLINNPENA